MKKIYIIFFIILFCNSLNAQNLQKLKMIEPKYDSLLKFIGRPKLYFPLYIINKDHVVYQKAKNIRLISKPDMKTFKVPNKHRDGAALAVDKNGVYVEGSLVKIDTTGFTPYGKTLEGKWMWKVDKGVFAGTKKMIEANPKTFERLKISRQEGAYHGLYIDDKHVYFHNTIVKGANADESVSLGEDLFSDGKYYYHNGEKTFFNDLPIQYINSSLQKTSKEVLHYFSKKAFPEIDAATLVPISRNYSKDKNYVYYLAETLPIDKGNFDKIRVMDYENLSYITDGEKIYQGKTEIPNVKQEFYGILPSSRFFYKEGGISFNKWNHETASSQVEIILPEIIDILRDANKVVVRQYMISENKLYDYGENILYKDLTKDQIKKVVEDKISPMIINGKLEFIKVLDAYLFQADDKKVYFKNKLQNVDYETFQLINGLYDTFKDKNYVYNYSREKGLSIIDGVDVETAVGKYGFLIDKDFVYRSNYKVIKSKDLEMVALIEGEVYDCSGDPDTQIFKNVDGYWMVIMYNNVRVRNLGKTLPADVKKILSIK